MQHPGATADAVGSGVREGGPEPARGRAHVQGQRRPRPAPELARRDRGQPEAFGVGPDPGPAVDDGDALCPEGPRDLPGVERTARAEHRPPAESGHDEHLRVRIACEDGGQVRRDVAVAVAHGVGHARGRHRVDAPGQPDQHRVGERDGQPFAEHAAPVPAGDTEAVHRDRGDGPAVAGQAGVARGAGPAADLERHDDAVARPHRGHLDAERDDLGHALVAELQRQRERRPSQRERPVHVAGGHGERAHHGGPRRRRGRLGDRHEAHPAAGPDHECAHPWASGATALREAVPGGAEQSVPTAGGVALECRRPGRGCHRAQHRRGVPCPAPGAVAHLVVGPEVCEHGALPRPGRSL